MGKKYRQQNFLSRMLLDRMLIQINPMPHGRQERSLAVRGHAGVVKEPKIVQIQNLPMHTQTGVSSSMPWIGVEAEACS
jgi:hypothetical protein